MGWLRTAMTIASAWLMATPALAVFNDANAQTMNLNPAPDWATRDGPFHPKSLEAFVFFRCFTIDENESGCAEIRSRPSTLALIAEVVAYDCIQRPIFRRCANWTPLIGGGVYRIDFWPKHRPLIDAVHSRFYRLCDETPTPPGCRWFFE